MYTEVLDLYHGDEEHFHVNNEIISAMESCFSSKSADFYERVIKGIFYRAEKSGIRNWYMVA